MCLQVIFLLLTSSAPAVPPEHEEQRSKCPDIQLQRVWRGAEDRPAERGQHTGYWGGGGGGGEGEGEGRGAN